MDLDHIDDAKGEMPADYRPYFEGEARFQRFTSPFGETPAVFAVHFGPRSRTRPHVHLSGQVLQVTSGTGIIADRSGRREIGPGDVITVQPGEWHWHGGTSTTAMTHLVVQVMTPGDIDWDVDEGDWAADY
jgi:quercetin dioxygenase-like cupin family protein